MPSVDQGRQPPRAAINRDRQSETAAGKAIARYRHFAIFKGMCAREGTRARCWKLSHERCVTTASFDFIERLPIEPAVQFASCRFSTRFSPAASMSGAVFLTGPVQAVARPCPPSFQSRRWVWPLPQTGLPAGRSRTDSAAAWSGEQWRDGFCQFRHGRYRHL